MPVLEDLDLLSEEAISDPHRFYGRLREDDPVHWNAGHRSWVLTRHEDVSAAFSDTRLSSDRVQLVYDGKLTDAERETRRPTFEVLADWMVFNDPPDHTRLRNLVKAAFTPRVVGAVAPRVEAVLDEVLDLPDRGEIDVVAQVAHVVPTLVIAEMLGVPATDRPLFQAWSEDVSKLIFGGARTEQDRLEAQAGLVGLADYLRALSRELARSDSDALLARLMRAQLEDDSLTEDEVVHTSILLLFGGHETTTNLIANGFLALMDEPRARAVLLDPATDVSIAIEELNRFDGPSRMVVRTAAEEIGIRGRTIRAGQRVYLCQSAANRDPRAFADPDRLDLQRHPNRHVAFGFGIHYCLGSALARMEAAIALPRMVERLGDVELTEPDLEWLPLVVVRGLRSLKVSYSA